EFLIHRFNGETVVPKRIPLDRRNLAIAAELIDTFAGMQGRSQGELDRQLQVLEGDSPDYRFKRGLSHILKNSFCTFEIISPLEPPMLRQRVFELAAQTVSIPDNAPSTLAAVATRLSQELEREIIPEQVRAGLYADLQENRILTEFESPPPETLLHRYNLSQVQGVFYKATELTITAHRNDPGEYKLLFRYLKLFQLMAYIEGDADYGFTVTIDGPTSLFKPSTRYGLAIAKLLPALLHVTKWSLKSTIQSRDPYSKEIRKGQFELESNSGLMSHYPPGKAFDSAIESAFSERWTTLKSDWKLEREVDLVPVPGSVMIPDFRIVHPDGRSYLLEIVGYWRAEYLRKKFWQVSESGRNDLILAISERLNLEKAGVRVEDVPAKVIWFKDKLIPKHVLTAIDAP
ncbi:MAG: DUF790 family protein, partial [Cyanobacteria bacterium P01_E01_bin.48]